MSSTSRPITLDELFGTAPAATSSTSANDAAPTQSEATPAADADVAEKDTAVAALFQASAPRREDFPAPSQSVVHLLPESPPPADRHRDDGAGDGYATPLYRGTQPSTADYSAISATVSREPTHSSFASPTTSTTSRLSMMDESSATASRVAGRRLLPLSPSMSAFLDRTSDEAAVQHTDPNSAFSTLALLRRFLDQRHQIAAASESPAASTGHSSLGGESGGVRIGSPVFDALRSARLVPSVVPAVAAAEANAESSLLARGARGPYLVESTYMRATTITTVLKRQKAERHAAFSDAHPFFRSQAPLADSPAAAPPSRLPTVLDMPLHLRCAMCRKHDAMCNRCHRRWASLQEAYRREAALRCYSTLDVSRRGALALLTAAVGTGSFLQMMSLADGLTLTQTRVRVTPAELEVVLQHTGRVLSAKVEERLALTEDASQPSREMWLKVAHMGCLFGQREILRSLWLHCAGGCSYAAQITTNGVHALELLAEPYDAAVVVLLNKSAALREYLLWARIMQCLAVKAPAAAPAADHGGSNDDGVEKGDDEVTQLCAALQETGSWVGIWSEALVAYVKGNKARCVELCDQLLAEEEATAAAVVAPSAEASRRTPTVSFASSLTGPPPPPTPPPSSQPLSTTNTAKDAFPAALSVPLEPPRPFSMRPVMNVDRVRALRDVALRSEEVLPRLEATEEEKPFTPVQPVLTPPQQTVAVPFTEEAASAAHPTEAPQDSCEKSARLPLRSLPFPVVRRVLSYCDAPSLLRVHEASRIPLLQWVTQARIKCLPAAQWTRLLTMNAGYSKLLHTLCDYAPPPTLSREEREAGVEDVQTANKAETHAGAAVALAAPPFQPMRVSVVDMEDLRHLTVKAVTLAHKLTPDSTSAAQGEGEEEEEEEPVTVGQWLLRSLFGRATSLVRDSAYLVLSRTYRLTAPEEAVWLAKTDVSEWKWEAVQPWEVDIAATLRWCSYVKEHAEAAKVL